MSTAVTLSDTRRKTRWSLSVMAAVTGVFVVGGTLMVAWIAVRLAITAVTLGMLLGVANFASFSVNATSNALRTGDSKTRLATLQQLRQVCADQGAQAIDPALAASLAPAVEQCLGDPDLEVVELAEELSGRFKGHTLLPPP